MPIAFRATSAVGTNASGTSLWLSRPSYVVNDLFVAVFQTSIEETTITPPTGWTLVFRRDSLAGLLAVYYRVATASESTSWQWTFNATLKAAGAILSYSGVSTSNPIDVSASQTTSNSTTVTAPSVTTTANGSLVVAAFGTRRDTTVSTPSGTTSRQQYENNATIGCSFRLVDFEKALAGSTGNKVATLGASNENEGGQIALRSANTAPNAPTLVSPVNSVTIDRTVTNRFDWTFSDPDPGDSQSEFQLRIRLQGNTLWDVDVTSETPTTHHDLAGGTLAAGDYEWQVRTRDAQGVQGPFSALDMFTAATPPAGPTITAPGVDETISVEDYTVTWSTPAQSDYQLRRVGDLAGTPDTGTVYFDTGTVVSSSARSRSVNFPDNGQTEHVQLRVRRDGLWSPWSTVRVAVSYTVPETPTLAVSVFQAPVYGRQVDAGLRVTPTFPTPGADVPAVESYDVSRRRTVLGVPVAGSEIRVAAQHIPSSTFKDWTVVSRVVYSYRIRARGDNGTSVYSSWTL